GDAGGVAREGVSGLLQALGAAAQARRGLRGGKLRVHARTQARQRARGVREGGVDEGARAQGDEDLVALARLLQVLQREEGAARLHEHLAHVLALRVEGGELLAERLAPERQLAKLLLGGALGSLGRGTLGHVTSPARAASRRRGP